MRRGRKTRLRRLMRRGKSERFAACNAARDHVAEVHEAAGETRVCVPHVVLRVLVLVRLDLKRNTVLEHVAVIPLVVLRVEQDKRNGPGCRDQEVEGRVDDDVPLPEQVVEAVVGRAGVFLRADRLKNSLLQRVVVGNDDRVGRNAELRAA